ncbi:hypothetical protein [Leeuwenhoekiella sp. NPDC079379]|uniref:hypothetical protein n=1 Tax=Leeuwenhoekiella sp. NPDC079379 TaxID=3364122 RepID=UPI0037C76EA3
MSSINFFSYSQTYNDVKTDTEKVKDKEISSLEMLSTLGVNFKSEVSYDRIKGNSIFLKQIGNYNEIQIFTKTENSDISLKQNGDYNSAKLNYTAQNVFAEILQDGNYNSITDYINNPRENISLELTQTGDNLNFIRENANQLTKSLKFNQSNASPNLIIRSFY